MPPEFEIRLPLKGKYAIYIGVPLLDWRPVLAGTGAAGGVDIALDGETFINVAPEYGIRRGKILEETGREIYCYFELGRPEALILPWTGKPLSMWRRSTASGGERFWKKPGGKFTAILNPRAWKGETYISGSPLAPSIPCLWVLSAQAFPACGWSDCRRTVMWKATVLARRKQGSSPVR